MTLRNVAFALSCLAVAHVTAAEDLSYAWRLPSVPLMGREQTVRVEAVQGGATLSEADTLPTAPALSEVPRYGLGEAFAAFPADRSAPQYWLGDRLPPPEGEIDWDAMRGVFAADTTGNYTVDPASGAVYAVHGGTVTIAWRMTDGSVREVVYQVSSVASGRPMRLFWTNAPYNGPTVSFSGQFVRLLGIEAPERVVDEVSKTESVTHGIYVDETTMQLHVIQGDLKTHPMLTGQMIVAYYDSGLYDRLLGLVPVEIAAPNPIDRTAFVGEALKPYGSGHNAKGLVPFPEIVTPSDNRGDYYYQHQGLHSYSPKHLNVYPLRPTEALNTRLQVWWKEYDDFGTLWPFEFCRYQCSWGGDAATFVRGPTGEDPGQPMTWDTSVTAELQKYQEPEGHASATDGASRTFSTQILAGEGAHWSLLKFTGDDNVWFLPVRSVACDDPAFFTGEAAPWNVGDEILPRGGNAMGTTAGYRPKVDLNAEGRIYAPHSGTNYNVEAYHPTDSSPENQTEIHPLPSAIFPVNVDPQGRPLEVWWPSTWQPDGMAAPVTFPTLAQAYAARWPDRLEAPRIVLASQLGSAMECRFASGKALRFDGAASALALPAIRPFPNAEGCIAFWVRASEGTEGRLLTLAAKAGTFRVTFGLAGGGLQAAFPGCTLKANGVADGAWHAVVLRFDAQGCALRVDGADVDTGAAPALTDCARTLDACFVGSAEGVAAPVGADFDALSIWWQAAAASQNEEALMEPGEGAVGLTLNLTFDGASELLPTASGRRSVREQVSGLELSVSQALACQPGAPKRGNGVILSDETPTIYFQNDPALPGYNPNEEHAFILAGGGGHVAWALRDDLNTADTSACGVLVSYETDGRRRMRWLGVERTDERYPELRADAQAGTLLSGPHPLDFLPGFWNTKHEWDDNAQPPFRDRKSQVWGICEGSFGIRLWYPFLEGFHVPGATQQPEVGDLLPWLDGTRQGDAFVFDRKPTDWTWDVKWPENVPTMGIGKTLTVAEDGLPEVWAAKSMAVVYPRGDAAESVVCLHDPTVMRTASLAASGCASVQDFIAKAGIDISDKGNAQYRNGTYTLRDLPPSVADRLTLDPNRPIDKALGLVGSREDNTAGVSLLFLNVLTETERAAVKEAFAAFAPADLHAAWNSAVDALGGEAIRPTLSADGGKTYAYSPVDHYALTSMGKPGYVTLLENDAADFDAVKEGDPISAHVLRVEPRLATAPLAVREDPTNLLSQQLSVLYGEPFAGKSGDWVFEWRKRLPDATGVVPSDIANGGYTPVAAPENGKTQILIGAAGDSLENMVNTYYAVRYRPVAGSSAWESLKEVAERDGPAVTDENDERMWSAWNGPTLAEGWVQRVLNNVTPFTQQMTDLYTQPAETAVSMIQKAGGPYNGDVALNQDNLPNVGLIQLYMTLLSKAESLSIANGPSLAAANQQLLLAATRAADLYAVLGDEAYADALNPTIGFGSDFATASAPGLGLDYGALSGGLFCFDNQVPSLLDEELALLRGRGADFQKQGLLRTAPYYNRLPWNFTRGVTAGEVAYAVNYNISGAKSASVDVEEAAKLYPQGHGDAYGHYLSALKLYYRLLRNPNFSWGTPGMGEMLLGDAVLNVDYYDENRFGEIAESMAETALATFDRTARKAYADNGGAPGGGYLDADPARGFGYGEWATKAGLGCLYNWAVGNSLLPEAPDPAYYHQAIFESGDYRSGFSVTLPETCAASRHADDPQTWVPFTVEFQATLEARQPELGALLFAWQNEDASLLLRLGANRTLTADCRDATQSATVAISTLPADTRLLVALGREASGALTVRVRTTAGTALADATLPNIALAGGYLSLGSSMRGMLAEIRWWTGRWRSDAELAAACDVVSATSEGLALYLRTFTRESNPSFLDDAACGCDWSVTDATWKPYAASGATLAFADEGLEKIDRASATSLDGLTRTMEEINTRLDRLDLGLNPLGLSDNAVPFDITPLGMEDGTSSHFEQILARAETALRNATSILDRAQTLGSRLRQLEEAQIATQDRLDAEEAQLESDLVGYYGTPYTDDIGPSGLYAQGYTGADYYHYMYMDLDAYGIGDDPATATNVVYRTYTLSSPSYSNLTVGKFSVAGKGSVTIPYTVSNDGFVRKPASFKGTRQTVGKLQQAYADALVEYVNYEEALADLNRKSDALQSKLESVQTLYNFKKDYTITWETLTGLKYAYDFALKVCSLASAEFRATTTISAATTKPATEGANTWAVAGMAVGTNAAGSVANSIFAAAMAPLVVSSTISNTAYANAKSIGEFITSTFDQALALYGKDVELASQLSASRNEVLGAVGSYYEAVTALRQAAARLTTATEAFSALRSEAEALRDKRELMRQQAVNTLTRARYNDMFFRQMRNEALARYEKSFALAQRYAYLAAQAYGYETAASMDALRSEIVAARTLGTLDAQGNPLPGGKNGDGGLADILARLKADWLVAKPRLGINNPQRDVTWISLRRELLRIRPGAEGDQAWRDALRGFVVEDLREHAWYRRHCQPIHGAKDVPEPALVIPFSSMVEFSKNFFGQPLAGGDSAFDSTYFATRIAGAGVRFQGYAAGKGALSSTPTAWLLPIGKDYLRSPGGGEDDVVQCSVVDQVVPLPYDVGESKLNNADWQPLYDGDFGGVDRGLRIRRHPSFRVTYGATERPTAEEDALRASRLVGRSVWNDQWALIIPFGAMNADRHAALEAFIQGYDGNNDGQAEVEGVSDILLGLRTYSHSGN